MLVVISGGSGGFKEYLENGQKKGRELHRNQLDQRIPLFCDLNVFEAVTSIHGSDGIKYDHATLSFDENYVSDEMLQIAVDEFREHYLSAWPESERHRIAFYAEAHRPKILTYINSETNEEISRCTHIHIGIGRHDLTTGESIEPLGYLGKESDNLKYVDAWQESFNAKHGFSSPKDNPKITPKNAIDVLASYTGLKPDALGKFGERKSHLEIELMKQVISEKITTWDDFENLLAKHGNVSKIHKGKFNECFRIKLFGSDKAMRLQGVFFQRQFIERPTDEKSSIFSAKARAAYLEQMQPRKEPGYVAGVLNEWNTIKARENRYLHTGSAEFRNYQAAFTVGLKDFDDEAKGRRLALANTLRTERNLAIDGLSGDARIEVVKQETARSKEAKIELKKELKKERRIIVGKQPIDAEMRLYLLDEIERKKNGIASPIATQSREIATARNRVPRMPVRNLDGISSRSKMLLRDHAGVDVRAEPAAEPDGPGVRQANARGRDRASQSNQPAHSSSELGSGRLGGEAVQEGRTGHVHVAQPSSMLARLQTDLRERYEQAADKERYAEIRQYLDCAQLLSSLSHTHGLNPALYQVATAKDGTPRIQCGSRALSASDFLTKELGLPWKEAAPILRTTYENQIEHKRTTPRTRDGKAVPSQLWREFKSEQLAVKQASTQQLKAFKLETKILDASLAAKLKDEKKTALAGKTGLERDGIKKQAALNAATQKNEFEIERAMLLESIQTPVQADAWRRFLQARAQAGNDEALAELRKLDDTARAAPAQSITGTIYLTDEDDENRRRRIRAAAALIFKVFDVALNGDITYHQHGQAVLVDQGQHLAVLDEHNEEAIGAALLLGLEKFGTNLTVTGSPDFQQRVVAVAVAQGIAVRFKDPQLDAIRQQLTDEKYKATRTPAKPAPKSLVTPLPLSKKSEQRAVEVSPDDPHQVAPTPVPTKEKTPSAPVAKIPTTIPSEIVADTAPMSAHEWLEKWSQETGKSIGVAVAENEDAAYTVVHIAPDGIVLDRGRTGAVYLAPVDLVLRVGDKVVVNNGGELCLPRTPSVEKNVPDR